MVQIIPQKLKPAEKEPLDGRYIFSTLQEGYDEAYDGAIFYISSLSEWYKFKRNAQGVLFALPDSAIDASAFALKTDLSGLASSSPATESAPGLMSALHYVKLRDIDPSRITRVAASSTNGCIRINDSEVTVYTRPNSPTDRPVSDAEKSAWNGKADGVHAHSGYAPLGHNHNTEYSPISHEHQVWDDVLGRYREKYVLSNSQGGGGDATSLGGLALNNSATGEGSTDAIWSASRVLSVVIARIMAIPLVTILADGLMSASDKTKLNAISGTNTGNETTATLGTTINGATAKATPADADMVGLMDSAAGSIIKKLSWENIKVTLKAYFDPLYTAVATTSVNGLMSAADKTKLNAISGTNSGDETTATLGSTISGATAKAAPADADMIGLMDSAAGSIIKKLSWGNIKATLKVYFDPLYTAVATTSANGLMSAADKTKLNAISGTNTGDETTATLGSKINGATAKATPVDADMVGLMDSAAGNAMKKLSWVNVKATLKTYFDTLYTAVSTTSVNGLMSATDKVKINRYLNKTPQAVICAATVTIDLSNGLNVLLNLTQSVTQFAFTNALTGDAGRIIIKNHPSIAYGVGLNLSNNFFYIPTEMDGFNPSIGGIYVLNYFFDGTNFYFTKEGYFQNEW